MTDKSARTQQPIKPLEETPEVAAAVEDETGVARLNATRGIEPDGPDFREPGDTSDFPATDEVIGDPLGGGTPAMRGLRTGADQPWDPEDLAVAKGGDATPEQVREAQRELDQDGPAAIERTVP